MSTADRPPSARPSAAARGFTIIEAVIVTVVVSLMTLAIERTITSVTETERTMRAIRNTAERGQKMTYALRDLVSSCRKIFGNEAVGQGYLAKLALGTAPLLAGSRLPTFDEVNPLGPDAAGTPETGNVMLLVREADSLPCIADVPTKLVRNVDSYRFVCAYTTQSARTVVAGGPKALDLVIWRSAAFPSYGQVVGIVDVTQKRNVVKDLYNRYGVAYLWDPTGTVNTSFYGIDGTGTIAASATAVASIPADGNVSEGPRFVVGNMAVARTDLQSKPRTPLFTVDPIATWTPNGFEVKVVGPSGYRKVWMRLTVEQQAAAGRVPAQETTVVVNTRDL